MQSVVNKFELEKRGIISDLASEARPHSHIDLWVARDNLVLDVFTFFLLLRLLIWIVTILLFFLL